MGVAQVIFLNNESKRRETDCLRATNKINGEEFILLKDGAVKINYEKNSDSFG